MIFRINLGKNFGRNHEKNYYRIPGAGWNLWRNPVAQKETSEEIAERTSEGILEEISDEIPRWIPEEISAVSEGNNAGFSEIALEGTPGEEFL